MINAVSSFVLPEERLDFVEAVTNYSFGQAPEFEVAQLVKVIGGGLGGDRMERECAKVWWWWATGERSF